jgi:hypothetical protein
MLARTLAVVCVLGGLAVSLSCARNVRQDSKTGPDGKVKNAVAIPLDVDGEGKAHGIVTYPGGDRVDWRKVELPADTQGELELALSWTPPRPGLALGIDVFDQYGKQVASERAHDRRTKREATIKNARGTYLIRIYAPFRGDAGEYRLKVTYAAIDPEPGFPPPGTQLPQPPDLPAVPPPKVPCDLSNYKTNPDCLGYCPTPVDATWPGCSGQCPQVPDVEIRACQKTMSCQPWDSRIAKCKGVAGPVCQGGVVSTSCEPPAPPEPVEGKVNNADQNGTDVEIEINRGTKQKVAVGWKGVLIDKRGREIAGSAFVVTKVGERTSSGVLKKMRTDQVDGVSVRLSPP